MLKLGIHMDNDLLIVGLTTRLLALILPIICPFFCLLRLNLCQFSPELCKLESSIVVYICRMSDCIVGLKHRVMALICLFFIHFSFRFIAHTPLYLSIFLSFKAKFVSQFSHELYKLESSNMCVECVIVLWD